MNKNLFKGWRQVFNFSFSQNVKGKGFKLSTIGVFLVIAVVFACISIIMATTQLKEKDKDDNVIDIKDSSISKIHFICDNISDKELVEALLDNMKENVKNIEVVKATKDLPENKLVTEEGNLVMEAVEEDNILKFNFYISEESKVDDGDVKEFASHLTTMVESTKYFVAGLDESQIGIIYSAKNGYIEPISIDEIDDENSAGKMLLNMMVPMIFSLLFYFIVLTYGQSVTKLIMAEKTSKLMETLLTSVKPYAIISGKVLAMAVIGMGQMVLWIAGGVVGFIVGDKIALSINPDYNNIVIELLNIIKSDSNVAFSPVGIILSFVSLLVGFLLFCIFAGFAGAVIDKVDDMSNAQLISQMPIIFGFMGSYFVTLLSDNVVLLRVVRFCPITSPFSVPAEILIGKVALWEALVSVAILIVTCFIITVITGKVYKNKLFNR